MSKRVARLCVLSFVLMGGALCSQAQANPIGNGNFATGDFRGSTLGTTFNGSPGPLPQVSSFPVTGSAAASAVESRTVAILPASGPKAGEGVLSFVAMLIVLIAIKYRGLIV